ncbi:MAG: LuxR C-terminal-related transcriptional regulator [Nocardioides sp.]
MTTARATRPQETVVLPPHLRPRPPHPPSALVPRLRLVERVEEGAEKGIVLVSGPAGAGKTMLLASWAEQRHPTAAWLSIEPEDADPVRFWIRVLEALQASPAVSPSSSLGTLRPPPVLDRRFASRLLAACNEQPRPLTLVLDDLHLLIGSPTMDALAEATRRGLGKLHLVVSTRADPPLPVQRLRLAGRVTELRAADLAFDRSEAALLLAQDDVHLEPAQLDSLLKSTEGWAAGIRLAAMSLHGKDVDQAIDELAGSHRTVADYFSEEVLNRLSPEMSQFLIRTSLPRRICADLAHSLTGREDSQQLLVQLERENLFVVALDDRRLWYRYHHLFGDLLRQRLATEAPAEREELNRLAAHWFATHGDPIESARHLAEAGAWQELARFTIRTAGAGILGVERHILADLLGRMPASLVTSDPEVATAAAVGAYARYDAASVHAHVSRARALLDDLAPADRELIEAVLVTLEAIAAWIEGDPEGEVRLARDALQRLTPITTAEMPALAAFRSGVTIVLGMGLLWSGRLDEADTVLTGTLRAVTEAQVVNPVLAVHLHGHLAALRAFQGALREADREARRTLEVAEASGWLYLPQSSTAYLAEGLIRLIRGDYEGCAVSIERGMACIAELGDPVAETGLTLARARLDLSTGNPSAALDALARLRRRASAWRMPWFLARWCDVVEMEAALADADPEARATALDLLRSDWGRERPEAHRVVLVARALLADNEPAEALTLLSRVTTAPGTDLVPAVEAWLLTALAQDRLRNDADASAALGRALTLAEPEGIVRPFLLAPERTRALLLRHQQLSGRHQEFTDRLLAGVGERSSQLGTELDLLEPLTNRERSVLLLLPTMMSNKEIADELFVSVNTVKVHLRSVYRKVGASNRREAVLRARALRLLDGDPGE